MSQIQDKIDFHPHEGQKDLIDKFLNHEDLRVACGRRWGKSMVSAFIALMYLLQDDKRVWVVGPSYDVTDKIFEYIEKWIKQYFSSLSGNIVHGPPAKIETPTGSFIKCKSTSSSSSLIGEQLDLVIVDEVARVEEKVYNRDIMPCLIDREGKTIFISTPYGKNWFYEEFLEAENEDYMASINYPTYSNPNVPESYVKKMRRKMPEEMYKQEIEAEFLEDGATMFRNLQEIIRDKGEVYKSPKKGHTYVMGVDLAKSKDWTVFVVIDRRTHEVVKFERFKDEPFPFVRKRMKAVSSRYNDAWAIIDSTGLGEGVLDELRRMSIPVDGYNFTSKSKEELIEKLRIFIEQKAITLPDEKQLIEELRNYGYITASKRTGKPLQNPKYGPIIGTRDDCVDALALSVWGLMDSNIRGDKKKKKRKRREDYFDFDRNDNQKTVRRFNYTS